MKLIAGAATAALGLLVMQGALAQTKPVYAVVEITDWIDADAYLKTVQAAGDRMPGGKIIVRTTDVMPLGEGTPPKRFVLIAFDDEAAAKAWWNDPGTKVVNASREKNAKSTAFMVEGLAK